MKSTFVALLSLLVSTSAFAVDFFQCSTNLNSNPASIVRVNIAEEKIITDSTRRQRIAREVVGVMGRVGAKSALGFGEANDNVVNLVLKKDDVIIGEIYATMTSRPGILEGAMRMEGLAKGGVLAINCVHHTLSK